MTPMADGPGRRKLHGLASRQRLRRRGDLDGTYFSVAATAKWQDKADESQRLQAITTEHT